MKALYDLKEMLHKELEEIARKPEMSAGDLEAVHKLTDTIKNIDKICMLEDESGYSEGGGWEAELRGEYGRGSSYANRGKHYVRGHYSRDGYGHSRDGYSRAHQGDGRYSRADGRDHMMEQLEELMDQSGSEDTREAIRRCIRELKSM